MYLGIDLGTSALKVILIDDDQNLLGEKNIPLEVNRPQTLFSEQSPEDMVERPGTGDLLTKIRN